MRPVYWIEDEERLLGWTRMQLEEAGCSCQFFSTASAFLRACERSNLPPGPIILDLWLPREEDKATKTLLEGPDVGIWLLKKLRNRLDDQWPIFIVSGNLTVDIMEQLVLQGIPRERVFTKPLNESNEILVERVLAAAA